MTNDVQLRVWRLLVAQIDRQVGAVRSEDGQLVTPFVLLVAGVALDPFEVNLVLLAQLEQLPPELPVGHNLPPERRHALLRQPRAQPFEIPLTTYSESLKRATTHGCFRAASPAIAAISSMRLFVVRRKPAENSRLRSRYWRITP